MAYLQGYMKQKPSDIVSASAASGAYGAFDKGKMGFQYFTEENLNSQSKMP